MKIKKFRIGVFKVSEYKFRRKIMKEILSEELLKQHWTAWPYIELHNHAMFLSTPCRIELENMYWRMHSCGQIEYNTIKWTLFNQIVGLVAFIEQKKKKMTMTIDVKSKLAFTLFRCTLTLTVWARRHNLIVIC